MKNLKYFRTMIVSYLQGIYKYLPRKYIEVNLNKDSDVIFPNICIVCGGLVKNEFVEIEGSYDGYFDNWKTTYKSRPLINIPCHKQCLKKLNTKDKLQFYIIFCILTIDVGIFYYLGKSILSFSFLLSISIIILTYKLILDKFWSPYPIYFIQYVKKTKFLFDDENYAKEFAKVNKSMLFSNNIIEF